MVPWRIALLERFWQAGYPPRYAAFLRPSSPSFPPHSPILLGAELNAEAELQTKRDTTTGPPMPMGRRQAYAADHTAEQRRR